MFSDTWDDILENMWDIWYDLWYDILDNIPRAEFFPTLAEVMYGIWALLCTALLLRLVLIPLISLFLNRLEGHAATPLVKSQQDLKAIPSPQNPSPTEIHGNNAMPQYPHTDISTLEQSTSEPHDGHDASPQYVPVLPFENSSGNSSLVRQAPLFYLSPNKSKAAEIQDEGIIELSEIGIDLFALEQVRDD